MSRFSSSRERFRAFLINYKQRQLDDDHERKKEPVSQTEASSLSRLTFLSGQHPRHLRDYWLWLSPHRIQIAAVLLLAIVVAALQMLEPLFMRYIIDQVLLKEGLEASSRYIHLQWSGTAFLIVIVFYNLFEALKNYRQRLLNVRIMQSLRSALFDRLLHFPLPKLWDMKTGGILSRLSGDIDTTAGLLQMVLISPMISLLRLFVAVGILFVLNWRLALVALALIPGAAISSFIFARRVKPIYRSVRKDIEHVDGRVGETFSGIRVVRAFTREMREIRGYITGRNTVLRKELFAHRRELLLWASWGTLISAVNVIIIWYGGSLNIDGRASIGDIMAFQWYAFLLLTPVWNLVNSFSEMQRSQAAMDRVFDILAQAPDKPDRPQAIEAPSRVSEIGFENVCFQYTADRLVFNNLSMTILSGTVVALVGRSGAGKTTLTDLVARFHDPSSGRITINGIDLRDIRLRSFRQLLAIVEQDVFLFDGTISDNIAYGKHDATQAEIEEAAELANAHEFIEKLPEQYETMIGERGVKLSGGQQQRLAIARAFLASPQILILDEATSNLDTESEQYIQASMTGLLAGRTTFVIAHRLSTIRRADLILLLEEGCVIEQGKHAELMSARGKYFEMVVRQMESQE